MKTNGGFLVTKIKQLGDRIFEKILSEKNIDAFNGAQGRVLYVGDGFSAAPPVNAALIRQVHRPIPLHNPR